MAKTSMVNREVKRAKLNKKYHKIRLDLKAVISDPNASDEDRTNAENKLQGLPRDSSRSRQRHRCRLCGRSRAYNRLTGLCRIHMRYAVMNGFVPGMHKASW
ncbi:MAG TPA: 30S ribosomal protein S14 [Gammaproteobacteria bacterium]|jgi:small subunit ribosomal protein S14|nr:30S ribosomal protein S14 [Gammaproteobacteria bacterium]